MKFVTYKYMERCYRTGLFTEEGNVVDLNYAYEYLLAKKGEPASKLLAGAVVPADSLAFLECGERAWKGAKEVLEASLPLGAKNSSGKVMVLARSEVKLGPPVINPGRIICLAHNYTDFLEETGQPKPPVPRIFSKYHNALCGPDDPIIYPPMTKELGYEIEVAVIIGKEGKYIPKEKALDYVAGYSIFNDVSASDLTGVDKQVLRGKTFDNFAPCGPYLVTKDEVPNPNNLDVCLWVNDTVLQSSNTSKLVYNVQELVSFLSEVFTLMPGDIIATGTPGGLAKDRNPTTFMNVGDVCKLEVEKLGVLVNPVVAEK